MRILKACFIILILLLAHSALKKPVFALCRQNTGDGQCAYPKTYSLSSSTYGSGSCKKEDAAARGITGPGNYEICCDYPTEINSDDSLRAPLCGSSEELFQANNTCWSCGSTLRCAGANQSALALGDTTLDLSISNRERINPSDTEEQRKKIAWLKNAPEGKFRFNGSEYDAGGRKIMVCTDNVGGCGATDTECTNELYSCFDNHGGDCGTRSKPQECQAYSFTSTSFYTPGSTSGINTAPSSPKACINVGDHLNELDSAKQALGTNGWVYIMAIPEWMDQIAAFIAANPDYSYMIRIHYPGRELTPSYMEQWASAIEKSAAKLEGARRILLMPVNEPNNPGGGRSVDPFTAQVAISALVQSLDQKGLLNTVVGVTSPMWDLSQSTSVYDYVDKMGGADFLKQFAAVAFASYGHYGDGNGGGFAGLNLMNGKISDFMSHYNLSMPTIIPETGVDVGGTVTYAPASGSIADFLANQTKQEWANTMATCIFSYNPDTHTDPNWIYSDQQVLNALKGGQASTNQLPRTSGLMPKAVTSTISYESCTEFGSPDITTKVAIPNLAKFGEVGTDKDGNSILSALWNLSRRPVKGILGFQGSKVGKPAVDEPSVFESLGMQLDRALPFLTPMAINVQPIVQEYNHTATSTLCYDNDEDGGAIQAFPIKDRIIIPAPGLNKLRQNGRMLAGFVAPNVSISQGEYEHLGELNPATLGSIRFNPTCDEPPSARIVRKTVVPTTEAEYYDLEAQGVNPIYYLSKWINRALSTVGFKCSETNCNDLEVNKKMDAHIKIKTPKIREILMDTTNDPSGKPVGALATFVPGSFYFPNEHGKVSGQIVEQEIGSNREDIKNVDVNYFGSYTMDVYNRVTNCSVRPDGELQENLGYSCNFSENDVTADRPLEGGTDPIFPASNLGSMSSVINDSAASGGIPACVLEGVKFAETGTRTDFSGECRVNDCSAAGPFQVTTGAAPAEGGGWDTHCTQCGPNWADGLSTCPDGWTNSNWPQTPTDPNPCEDVSVAASRAVQMLRDKAVIRCESLDTTRSIQEQKTAIITAAGSYYGSNVPIARFGGCSYGEFVYKHCDNSYVCGTANVDLAVKYEQCHPQNGREAL